MVQALPEACADKFCISQPPVCLLLSVIPRFLRFYASLYVLVNKIHFQGILVFARHFCLKIGWENGYPFLYFVTFTVLLPHFTVIVAVPAFLALITPLEDAVAIFLLEVLYVTLFLDVTGVTNDASFVDFLTFKVMFLHFQNLQLLLPLYPAQPVVLLICKHSYKHHQLLHNSDKLQFHLNLT